MANGPTQFRVMIKHPRSRTQFVDQMEDADGSFTGSAPLNRFVAGTTRITVNGISNGRILHRDIDIELSPPQGFAQGHTRDTGRDESNSSARQSDEIARGSR